MKTLPSPRKKKAPDESRKAFFFACGVYAPLLALLTTLSTENFAGAGTQATVALTFAQLTGGGPVAPAGDRSVSDAEPVPEPVAQPAEETAPEPISEPEPVPEPEPEPAPVREPELEPVPVPEPEPEPVPEPVPVPEPKAAPVRKQEPKPVPEARKEVKPQPAAKKPTKKEAPKTVVKKATSEKPSETRPDATREGATSPVPSNVARTGGATASQQGGIATMVYGEVHDPFLAEVKRSVESVLEYPRKARAMRMEGTAFVQFVIDASGRLESLEPHKSAGKPLLDKMALKAVRRAQGLWSKPQKTVRLRFPIRFELRG